MTKLTKIRWRERVGDGKRWQETTVFVFIVFCQKMNERECDENDPTYWKRVIYSEEMMVKKRRPWTLKYVEGKGFAAFATKAYKVGEIVCTEFPVVWIHGHHPFNESQIAEIHEKVNFLNEEDKAAFYNMANEFSEDEYPSAVGIFMTNCFDMTDSIYGITCAMYLALARLNHSCSPNVQQTHFSETTEEVLIASRDIAEGEEINDCYIDLRQSRDNRQKSLSEYYRFTCECISCHLINEVVLSKVDQQDKIREEAASYDDKIILLIENQQLSEALNYCLSIINRLEDTESIKWSIRYLPEAYHTAYQIYFSLAEEAVMKKEKAKCHKLAMKYLKRCYKLSVLLQSERSPDSKRTGLELKKFSNNSSDDS
jgi:hypothetical protein